MHRPLNINPSISQWSYQQKKLPRESPNIKILLKPETAHWKDLFRASRSSLTATKLTKPATSSTTWRRGNRSCRRQGQVTVGATNPRNPPRFRSWRLSHWPSRIFHKWRWSSCRRRWFQEGFLEIPWEVVEMWVTTPLYHVAKSLGISQSFTRFTNLIPCEHHSSWCANVAMRVSDAASFDTPALSFQTKRSRDEILDDLKRIMKLKPKARWGIHDW